MSCFGCAGVVGFGIVPRRIRGAAPDPGIFLRHGQRLGSNRSIEHFWHFCQRSGGSGGYATSLSLIWRAGIALRFLAEPVGGRGMEEIGDGNALTADEEFAGRVVGFVAITRATKYTISLAPSDSCV
jgi:hypothetical protein